MQLLYLSQGYTILLSFILWPIFQISAALAVRLMPAKFFRADNPVFRSKKFEKNGKIYEKYFKIKSWKKYLPDGSAITGVGLKKKQLSDVSNTMLCYYLSESCRAELIHLLAIPPFILFGLFCPLPVVLFMLFYALAVNLPCLITQRYNRPRIERILKRRSNKLI